MIMSVATPHLPFVSTLTAARELGISYAALYTMVRDNKVSPPPVKDGSGRLVWFPENVAAARRALRARRGRRAEE
jgi:hypothetical protein